MLNNKSPSQISLLGSMTSISNRSPSQISLLGSNSSISTLARSNASIADQVRVFRSPYGSPNLSDRSKSPYLQNIERSNPSDRRSPNLNNRDVSRSPRDLTRSPMKVEQSKPVVMQTSHTSEQIFESSSSGPPTEPKPMFSTLPRQRSIPTIIGMPRRLSEPRKSLPQVPTSGFDQLSDIPKNPFEKVEDISVPVPPSGKNPFLDEDDVTESYSYDNVMNRVIGFEKQTGGEDDGQVYHTTIDQYGAVVTTTSHKFTGPLASLQYSVPVSSGKVTDSTHIRPETHRSSYGSSPHQEPSSRVYQGPPKAEFSHRPSYNPPSRPESMHRVPYDPPPRPESSPRGFFDHRNAYDPSGRPAPEPIHRGSYDSSMRPQPSGRLYDPGIRDPIPGMIREDVSDTPTPSSSTGTDSSRRDVGRDGDLESGAESEDDMEIAELGDTVPELRQ